MTQNKKQKSSKIWTLVTNSKTLLLHRKQTMISNNKSKMSFFTVRNPKVKTKQMKKICPSQIACKQVEKRRMDRIWVMHLKDLSLLSFSIVRMQEESSRKKIRHYTQNKSWNWCKKIGVLCLSPRKSSIRSKVGSIGWSTMRERSSLMSRRAKTQIQAS